MGLLCQPSGKAALIFVRKFICPLPAPSSTRKKYVHMHGLLGTFRPAYQYLTVKLPQLDEYYRVCAVVFDEMKITKVKIFYPKIVTSKRHLLIGKELSWSI